MTEGSLGRGGGRRGGAISTEEPGKNMGSSEGIDQERF